MFGFSFPVHIERVELGFAYTAKANSEGTHRLPPPPNAYGEKDFGRILYKINKFLKDSPAYDDGKHMVFTYSDPYANDDNQVDVIKNFLQQFAGEKEHRIDVYPMTRLFYVLRNELADRGKCESIPNENFCNILMSRDSYEASAGISCSV